VETNARNNIASTVIVTVDRLVSALSAEALNSHIEQATLDELLFFSTQCKEYILSPMLQYQSGMPDTMTVLRWYLSMSHKVVR